MKNIITISSKLNSIWKKLYIVWWWCREKILNGNSSINLDTYTDIDLTTDATPNEMKKVLKVIKEVWKKYWTLIIIENGQVFEITTFRRDIGILDNRKPVKVTFTNRLDLDSKRRDFTFNAIYFDVQDNVFIDPEFGIKDLENKKIRFVWNIEDRITEDALRILRFVRFKNYYNLEIWENNYFPVLKEKAILLKNISIERIKQEFDKILLLKNNINALNDLIDIGFFKIFLPEINNLNKTPGWPKHHLEWNVWIHTLMTIAELNKIFEKWFDIFDKNWEEIIRFFDPKEKLDLYRTMLLHDIGKFKTFSQDENGNVHYYGHEEIWSELFVDIAKRFKLGNNSKKLIKYLIDNHLKVFKAQDMKKLKSRKFMMNKYFEFLILVWTADNFGKIPTNEECIIRLKEFYKEFLLKLKTKVFLTGNDILRKYPNLKGREIKEKLNAKNDEILLEE